MILLSYSSELVILSNVFIPSIALDSIALNVWSSLFVVVGLLRVFNVMTILFMSSYTY